MIRLLLPVMLTSIFLFTGCSTTTSNTQASPYDRRMQEAINSDKTIEDRAKEEINDDEDLRRQTHVNINAFNGAVLVTGEVPSEDYKNKVIALIRVIAHVKMVHDNLVIAAPSGSDSRSNDTLITDEVKTALTQIHTLAEFDPSVIKIVTENATVYLMGRVHANEGSVVVNLTRMQPGVKKIITVFEYID